MCFVIAGVLDAMESKTWLPHAELGFQPEGESALDILHGFFEQNNFRRREKKVDVIGHQDEGVEMIAVFCAILPENVEEEFGVRLDLKESTTVCGIRCDEECPDFLRSERHLASLVWEAGFAPHALRNLRSAGPKGPLFQGP